MLTATAAAGSGSGVEDRRACDGRFDDSLRRKIERKEDRSVE